MSSSYNKFNAFVANIANGTMNLGTNTLEIALSDTLPVATNSNLADITQISYTNLSARTFTATSSTQTSGTYKLVANQLTLTATGTVAQFRYVILYNATAAGGPLIGWWDFGSELNMINGDTFTVGFDLTNGILQLS